MTRNQLLLLIGVVLVILFIFGLLFKPETKVGTGKEYSASEGPALINSGTDLYNYSGSSVVFNNIADNIGFFARNTVKEYSDGSLKDITFKVTSSSKTNKEIKVEGELVDTKKKLAIIVNLLNNNRMSMKISLGEVSIDSLLPANSKRNQFIGSLPFKNTDFNLSYLESSDGFMITLLNPDFEKSKASAEQYLKEQLGTFDGEFISVVGIDANGNPKSLHL